MNYFLFEHLDFTQLLECGIAMLNPGWKHMKRKLENESVLIIGKKNSTLIEDEGETLEVKPGRMILLSAKRLHFGKEPIGEAVSYYWFHFNQSFENEDKVNVFLPKLIDEKDAQIILSNKTIYFQRLKDSIILPQFLDFSNTNQIQNLCNEILAESKNPDFSPLIVKNLFVKLMLELGKETLENQNRNVESDSGMNLVNQILFMLESELSNPDASVKYFANKLNLNSDYIGRVFKNAMNISIGQYISKKRVELACSRLRETNNSIEDIYIQCGFGSRRQFYDEFKNLTNKTPAAYRANCAYVNVNML